MLSSEVSPQWQHRAIADIKRQDVRALEPMAERAPVRASPAHSTARDARTNTAPRACENAAKLVELSGFRSKREARTSGASNYRNYQAELELTSRISSV